jgi:hypothetical protein
VTVRSLARTALFVCMSAVLDPQGAIAQFDQYRAPGGPQEPPRTRRQSLESAIAEARWQFGKLRVDPWLGVSNVEYVDNVFGAAEDETSDITATGGAGLRLYLPTGRKVTWAAHALPEYTWWQDQKDRRGVNGRYGLGVFGFFNRLTVEASATRDQGQRIATPEVPQPVRQRLDRAGLGLEVEVSGGVSVFAAGELQEVRHRRQGSDPRLAPLDRLDRDLNVVRAGLRYRFGGGWAIGAGAERTATDFLDSASGEDRSNRGTSPFLELRRDGANEYLRLEVSQRSLEPVDGSVFVPYDETSASFELGLNTGGRLVSLVYGGRSLVYSLAAGYSDLQDDRLGVAFDRELGWRTRLRVFSETGRNDYRPVGPEVPDRRDDSLAYGVGLTFKVGERSSFVLQLTHTEYDSNLPLLDREVTTLGTGINLGGRRTSWY